MTRIVNEGGQSKIGRRDDNKSKAQTLSSGRAGGARQEANMITRNTNKMKGLGDIRLQS